MTVTIREAQVQNLKVWCRRFGVTVSPAELDRLKWREAGSVRGLPLGLCLMAVAKQEIVKIDSKTIVTEETEIAMVSALGAAAKMTIYEKDSRDFVHVFYQNLIESMSETKSALLLSKICYFTPTIAVAYHRAVNARGSDQAHNSNTLSGMILNQVHNQK